MEIIQVCIALYKSWPLFFPAYWVLTQTIENVHAVSGGTPTLGTLKLSNFHIIFCAPFPVAKEPSQTQESRPPRQKESWITYPIISHCTFRPTPPTSGIPSTIRIRCRDFNFVTFNFTDDKQAKEAFEFIRNRTCRLGGIDKLYAFHYTPAKQEKGFNGWDLYDARAEFRRQGISEKSSDKGWRISTINQDYAFSPTYPALLAVPSKISDNVLKYAANFRSRARIPTLSYYHPVTNCTITRSSQPFVGLRNNRSIQDERLVGACFYPSTDFMSSPANGQTDGSPASSQQDLAALPQADSDLSETERLEEDMLTAPEIIYDEETGQRIVGARRDNLIVDARPAINSYAMQAIGYGSENMEYYKSAKKVFLSIDNIHVMRDSLNKVIDAIKDADISPFACNRELLAKSGWLKHITGILDGSQIIARQVGVHAAHVLIHCSDGWDRTSQLSALSQIMLDPYYRTIDGFIILVEKDWLSFGHMFQQRSGFLNHDKWFISQSDAMAGARIEPGENDGRNDAIENAMASAKRFFRRGQEKDESDADSAAISDEPTAKQAPITDNQATRPKEISPVFHQFLDATYQLLRQHPNQFEFNERFLRRLLYHLYSCQYGTFLYNNERQRRDAKVKERTSSVWDYFLSRRQEFTNPEYDPNIDEHTKGKERLIFPRLKEVRWWHQVFNRTDEDMNGGINAAQLHAEKIATYQSASPLAFSPKSSGSAANSQPGSPRRGTSPRPPGLPMSQSVLSGVETAHSMLTPGSASTPSLTKSASAGAADPGAFATLREGIAGLGIGQKVGGVLGGRGNAARKDKDGAGFTSQDQELT